MNIKQTIMKYNPVYIIRRGIRRRRLKEKSITILASNCMAGLIYNDLGVRFNSPTINTRIDSKEFVQFVTHLEYYMNQELCFVAQMGAYPIATIGQEEKITIHFVHYQSEEEARTKWYERIERIDKDHLFIMTNDFDGICEDDIEKLDNSALRNIVVFSSKQYNNHRSALWIRNYELDGHVNNLIKRNAILGDLKVFSFFDYVEWFNQSKGSDIRAYARKR